MTGVMVIGDGLREGDPLPALPFVPHALAAKSKTSPHTTRRKQRFNMASFLPSFLMKNMTIIEMIQTGQKLPEVLCYTKAAK